jgi:hypothetical protein
MAEKYGYADRFWLWLYRQARKRLPRGYRDEIWQTFVQEKMEQLRTSGYPDEFILFLAEDVELRILGESGFREIREQFRDIRDDRY